VVVGLEEVSAEGNLADCAILQPGQQSNFTENRVAFGYAQFDNRSGQQTATLPAGTYYVGVRGQGAGQIGWAFALEHLR